MRRRWQILVLSQQLDLRVLLRIVFTRMHHAIDIVTTRTEARIVLEYLKQKPDLVIADLYLNDESGLAFAADVRALYPQQPILLIPPCMPGFNVPQEDIDTASQLGVTILDSRVGIGDHHFNLEIHKLVNRASQGSDTL